MYREPDSRRRQLGGVLFFLVSLALLLYLAFAALHSDYGLIRLVQVEEREAALQRELAGLRAEREAMASRTARLSGDRPDLDLLDERARRVLGLGRPDELLIR
jgi:cell division protein FtsB